jgi:D-alanyl-D-alanine carboxypeptidase
VCIADVDNASAVVGAIRSLRNQLSLQAVMFGVWKGAKPLTVGALGTAYPRVPADRAMHFRIGNTTESITTTRLLQLVEDGKLTLDDPISTWFPALPRADDITVRMLATSTSGYAHYVNVPEFIDAYHADVFASWRPEQLIEIGTSQPMLFEPGTQWLFSDTNFVILGEIIRKVGGTSVSNQIERSILDPLGMRDTNMTATAVTPPPVLHSYTDERGPWEDATFWSPTWTPYAGNMTSTLDDLGRWARALGSGSLLSKASHEIQTTPAPDGLGKFSDGVTYVFGTAVTNGWVFAAPGLLGITGVVANLPAEGLTVVIFTSSSPSSPEGTHYAAAMFNEVGEILAPEHAPQYPATR